MKKGIFLSVVWISTSVVTFQLLAQRGGIQNTLQNIVISIAMGAFVFIDAYCVVKIIEGNKKIRSLK